MKANERNKENPEDYKLNIEHKEEFHLVKKAVIDQVDNLSISAERKEELHRFISNLIELAETDAFFTGFKACAEFSRGGQSK